MLPTGFPDTEAGGFFISFLYQSPFLWVVNAGVKKMGLWHCPRAFLFPAGSQLCSAQQHLPRLPPPRGPWEGTASSGAAPGEMFLSLGSGAVRQSTLCA